MTYRPRYKSNNGVFGIVRKGTTKNSVPGSDTDAWKADLDVLLENLIQDEIEAARKYRNFVEGVDKYGVAPEGSDERRRYKQMRDVAAYIKTQEEQHHSILERLKGRKLYFGGYLNK